MLPPQIGFKKTVSSLEGHLEAFFSFQESVGLGNFELCL